MRVQRVLRSASSMTAVPISIRLVRRADRGQKRERRAELAGRSDGRGSTRRRRRAPRRRQRRSIDCNRASDAVRTSDCGDGGPMAEREESRFFSWQLNVRAARKIAMRRLDGRTPQSVIPRCERSDVKKRSRAHFAHVAPTRSKNFASNAGRRRKQGKRSAEWRIHFRLPRLDEQARPRPGKWDRTPSGAPRRLAAIMHPNSAWAALPGITGCKREDPLRHQCSRHPAVRSRAGRDDALPPAGKSDELHPREPHPLRQSAVTG